MFIARQELNFHILCRGSERIKTLTCLVAQHTYVPIRPARQLGSGRTYATTAARLQFEQTAESTRIARNGVTVVINVRLKAVMAIAVELNAFIVKEANCLINIIIWGMRTEFR